ncbi:MAG: hypothetical protein GY871_04370 [Actinomycetales bacterium]|nr:hypothetical protein [Actinomycetales bacterium]
MRDDDEDKNGLFMGRWADLYCEVADPLDGVREVHLGIVKEGIVRAPRSEFEFGLEFFLVGDTKKQEVVESEASIHKVDFSYGMIGAGDWEANAVDKGASTSLGWSVAKPVDYAAEIGPDAIARFRDSLGEQIGRQLQEEALARIEGSHADQLVVDDPWDLPVRPFTEDFAKAAIALGGDNYKLPESVVAKGTPSIHIDVDTSRLQEAMGKLKKAMANLMPERPKPVGRWRPAPKAKPREYPPEFRNLIWMRAAHSGLPWGDVWTGDTHRLIEQLKPGYTYGIEGITRYDDFELIEKWSAEQAKTLAKLGRHYSDTEIGFDVSQLRPSRPRSVSHERFVAENPNLVLGGEERPRHGSPGIGEALPYDIDPDSHGT